MCACVRVCVCCLWVREQGAHSSSLVMAEGGVALRMVGGSPCDSERGEASTWPCCLQELKLLSPTGSITAILDPCSGSKCVLHHNVEELRHKPPLTLPLQQLCGLVCFMSLFPLYTSKFSEPGFTCPEVGIPRFRLLGFFMLFLSYGFV